MRTTTGTARNSGGQGRLSAYMGKSGWLGSKRASDASEVKGRETRKLTKDRGWSGKVGGGRTTARTTDDGEDR